MTIARTPADQVLSSILWQDMARIPGPQRRTPYTKKMGKILGACRRLLLQNNPHLAQEFADLLAAELDGFIRRTP